MVYYLKGNAIFEVLLDLCRMYQLMTPIVRLERFKDFDVWVVNIDNNENTKSIIDYLNINKYNYNILRIDERES